MSSTSNSQPAFGELNLIPPVLKALDEVGYETPTPIQAQAIPLLLAGRDLLGQAQTGTGKTAAFALPLLSRIDLGLKQPQVLVLAPTRELAIQVAEAFQTYAHHLKGFHVLPIYGGQDYGIQLKQLKRGTHVVVGTPGRVMDHMRRGTLRLDRLQTLVLDEADEMLRMGFIDDVKWVLEQTPPTRQIALFSATMPAPIRRIAEQHLNNPAQISIKVKTTTAETIRQRYWTVSGAHKLDVLTRILEAEPFDGIIIFVRTKTTTVELADKLAARGYSAAALNGDIAQKQREQIVAKLKNGKLDILVATDVAARGLDVERISHVINYDVPYDTESYVHRIGRTGRAGRAGDAILFVSPRERHMLGAIERATRQKIEQLEMPSTESINDRRIAEFKQRITDTLAEEDMELFSRIVEQYVQEYDVPAVEVAAALARMAQGDKPLLVKHTPAMERGRKTKEGRLGTTSSNRRPSSLSKPERGMERYRLSVGELHGVKAGNIVGAIANEIGIDNEFIQKVDIQSDYSTVDLPEGMPKPIFKALKQVRIAGRRLDAEIVESPDSRENVARHRKRFGTKGKPKDKRDSGEPRKPQGKLAGKRERFGPAKKRKHK